MPGKFTFFAKRSFDSWSTVFSNVSPTLAVKVSLPEALIFDVSSDLFEPCEKLVSPIFFSIL